MPAHPESKPLITGAEEVQPGLYPDGTPRTTEVVCVETDKIYDFCYQEHSATRCVALAGIDAAARARAELLPAACAVTNRVYGSDGLADVSLTITVPVQVTAGNASVPVNFVIFKTVQMAAPLGTVIECEVTGGCLAEAVDMNGDGIAEELCCMANLYIVLQSKARVKLLVPAFGYCAPGLARERPSTTPPPFSTDR